MTSRRSRERNTIGSRMGRVEDQTSKQAKILGEVRREIVNPTDEKRITENDLGLINRISAEDEFTIDAPGPVVLKKGTFSAPTRSFYTFDNWTEALALPQTYLRTGDELYIHDVYSSGCYGLYRWDGSEWIWKEGETQGTATQRDRYWGMIDSPAARFSRHEEARTWYRPDKGWTEQYFASSADGATRTTGAVSVAGWYPISGRFPKARWYRDDGVQNMGRPGWNTQIGFFLKEDWGSPEIVRNPNHADQLFLNVGGFYKSYTTLNVYVTAGSNNVIYGEFAHIRRDNPTAGFDYQANTFQDIGSPISGASTSVKVGTTARYNPGDVFQLSMNIRNADITSRCYRDHYFSTIEYVSPPYLALATTTGD